MQQTKFSIEESQVTFLNQYQRYGFKDKSTMVREALHRFKQELERQQLEQSAELYAETYVNDGELRELTEQAITGWPE
jgi:hypothetical protein